MAGTPRSSSPFRDLDEFLVVEPIRLPIKGKIYEFPGEISAWAGVVLQRMVSGVVGAVADGADGERATEAAVSALDTELLSDAEEHDLSAELFGDAEAQMVRDGLTSAHLRHVFLTLIVHHALGEDAALAVWQGQGKAEPANRTERRAAKKTTGRSGAAASTTKRRASTSGTSRRSTSPPKRSTKRRAAGG